ncbi:MAG TPA: hypothetical protein PLM07_16765 [Candidatus Rifleibacterium sp.]|nr:hypothetical protein [Candidatus Rifleibacterium sp.]HPT47537.1 hypothetical protein [Candidatus Rifleibacterium sp.]
MSDHLDSAVPVRSWRFPFQARVVGIIIAAFACFEFAQVSFFWVRLTGVLLALFWVPVALLNMEKAKQEQAEWLPGSYVLWAFIMVLSLFILRIVPGMVRYYVGNLPFLGPYWLLFGLWFFFHANRIAAKPSSAEASELSPGRTAFLTISIGVILTLALPFIAGSYMDALIRAAKNGRVDRFAPLLEGVRREISENPLENALCRAVDEHQAGLVEWLLTQGPDVNRPAGKYVYRPLWWAIRGDGSLQITEMLLKAGANPNLWLSGSSGDTALGLAVELHSNNKESLPYIRILASYGADLNQPVKAGGKSLIAEALTSRFEPVSELIQELLNLGARFPVNNGENLFYLSLFARDPAVFKILQANGVECTAVDKNGRSFLHLMLESFVSESYSRSYHYAEFVPRVINQPDNEGKTPLRYAVELNEPSLVETLMKWNADAYKPDKNGVTPRSAAEKMRYLRVLKIIDSAPAASNK